MMTVTRTAATGSDFARGTPYSLRNGKNSVLSHGLSIGKSNFDSISNFLKGSESRGFEAFGNPKLNSNLGYFFLWVT
jgi:Reversibly glycosylated polypeptide